MNRFAFVSGLLFNAADKAGGGKGQGKTPDNPDAPIGNPPAAIVPPAANVNPFMELFESVQFATSASGKTYPNTDGSSSKKVASGICIVRGGFVGVSFNVYARRSAGAKPTITADVSFVGTRQTQALSPLNEKAKAQLTEYKGLLAGEYREWRKQQGKIAAPISKTAAVLDDADDLFAE